jgi:hypothetical protein
MDDIQCDAFFCQGSLVSRCNVVQIAALRSRCDAQILRWGREDKPQKNEQQDQTGQRSNKYLLEKAKIRKGAFKYEAQRA